MYRKRCIVLLVVVISIRPTHHINEVDLLDFECWICPEEAHAYMPKCGKRSISVPPIENTIFVRDLVKTIEQATKIKTVTRIVFNTNIGLVLYARSGEKVLCSGGVISLEDLGWQSTDTIWVEGYSAENKYNKNVCYKVQQQR